MLFVEGFAPTHPSDPLLGRPPRLRHWSAGRDNFTTVYPVLPTPLHSNSAVWSRAPVQQALPAKQIVMFAPFVQLGFSREEEKYVER
jgi:hypothetical protein